MAAICFRNIGSAVGISIVIAQLTSMITQYHSQLVDHVTPFSDAMHMPLAGMLSGIGLPNLAMMEQLVTQQAAAMAYSNDFLLMTLVSLAAFPLLALIRSPKAAPAQSREAAAHAVMDWRIGSDARFRRRVRPASTDTGHRKIVTARTSRSG